MPPKFQDCNNMQLFYLKDEVKYPPGEMLHVYVKIFSREAQLCEKICEKKKNFRFIVK